MNTLDKLLEVLKVLNETQKISFECHEINNYQIGYSRDEVVKQIKTEVEKLGKIA